jgi:trehalose utilization protein
MGSKLRKTVGREYVHERKNAVVAEIYPKGMHQCIADGLSEDKTLDVCDKACEPLVAKGPSVHEAGEGGDK